MKVAIVIPYYKIDFFEETLISLANQTNKNFNVYIGNDASPDCPDKLIKKYKDQFNLKYIEFDRNLGRNSLTDHWERCIKMTDEEQWITILGDDDYYEPELIESFFNERLSFQNINVVRFSSQIKTEQKKTFSNKFFHPKWEFPNETLIKKLQGKSRSSLSEYFFKKNIYYKYKFYDYPLAWHSDDRAWLDFSEKKPIYTINSSSVIIRNSRRNISGRKDNLIAKNKASILFYKYLLWEQKGLFKQEEIFLILRQLENSLFEARQLGFKEKMGLLNLYLQHFKIYNFRKAIKRFLIS